MRRLFPALLAFATLGSAAAPVEAGPPGQGWQSRPGRFGQSGELAPAGGGMIAGDGAVQAATTEMVRMWGGLFYTSDTSADHYYVDVQERPHISQRTYVQSQARDDT